MVRYLIYFFWSSRWKKGSRQRQTLWCTTRSSRWCALARACHQASSVFICSRLVSLTQNSISSLVCRSLYVLIPCIIVNFNMWNGLGAFGDANHSEERNTATRLAIFGQQHRQSGSCFLIVGGFCCCSGWDEGRPCCSATKPGQRCLNLALVLVVIYSMWLVYCFQTLSVHFLNKLV